MHQEIQHRPLIQRFIEAKINNPNLLASLLNFSTLIDSTQLKITQLQQRIHHLQSQLQSSSSSLHSASQLQQQHYQQLSQLNNEIEEFAHKINLKQHQQSTINDQVNQELQRIQTIINQEQQSFISTQNSQTKRISQLLQVKKSLQNQILIMNKDISEKKVNMIEVDKLAQKNQKIIQITNIKRQLTQQLKLKEQQCLTSLAKPQQLNQLKINNFINEVNDIITNGTLTNIYDLSIKYVTDYQLTQTQLHHKHSSSQTMDEEDVEALQQEITNMEKLYPELRAHRLDITIDRTYELHDYSEDKLTLDEEIRLKDQAIEKMEGEEKQLDEFIIDLKTKLNQKQNQITTLGILRLAAKK